jgi:uncharacterized membrane protein YadS
VVCGALFRSLSERLIAATIDPDQNLPMPTSADPAPAPAPAPNPDPTASLATAVSNRRLSDDSLAMAVAGLLLLGSLLAVWLGSTADEVIHPLGDWIGKPAGWTDSPWDALMRYDDAGDRDYSTLVGIGGSFLLLSALLSAAVGICDGWPAGQRFLAGFVGLFALAAIAYGLAGQSVIKAYNLEYALWALLVGLIISNTIGTSRWLHPAVRTEFYIKIGLVLLGAEILMSRLLALGLPGVFVAWVVTPIVLVSTYAFGQRVLKLESRSLNMVISADMSVCGVSAAIAAAAACKAKKEELSLAIGMSLSFTVLMMVAMPALIKMMGLDEVVGGAWMGGTIDSTGAVAAAGAALGDRALEVAATVKMIQNILIGVSAFAIATYWVTYVEHDPAANRPRLIEIWFRFPKFVLGFIAASILFSLIHSFAVAGPAFVDATIDGSTKTLRGWLFCLAFVSIGLETKFSELAPYFKGGKPLILYVSGQTLNLVLTLTMAYLMFGVLFKDYFQ